MSSVIPSQPQDRAFSANYPRSSLYSGGLSKYYQPLFLSAEIDQILSSSSFSQVEATYPETDEDDLFNFNLTFSFDGELESLDNEDSEGSLSNSFDSIHRSVGKATNALEKAFTDSISADSYSKSLGKDDRESYQDYWRNGLTRYSGGILPLWDETDLDEQIDSIQYEIAKVNEERRLLHRENNPVNSPSQSQDSTPVSSPVSLPLSSSSSSLSSLASPSPSRLNSSEGSIRKEKKSSSKKNKIITVVSPVKDSKRSLKISSPSSSSSYSSPISPMNNTKKSKIVNLSQKNSILNQRTQIEKIEEPSDDLVILDIIDTDQLSISTPSSNTNRSKVSGYCLPISPSSNTSSGAESPNSSQDERPFYSSEESSTIRSSYYPSQHKTTPHFSASSSTILKKNSASIYQGLNQQNPLKISNQYPNHTVLNNSKKRISSAQQKEQDHISHSLIPNSKRARTKQMSEIFRLEQVHKVQSINPDDEDEEIDIL